MAAGDDTISVKLSSYHHCDEHYVIARGSLSVQDQGQTVEDEAHRDVVTDHPPGHVLYT